LNAVRSAIGGRSRHGIEQHFARHLGDADVEALARALEKVSVSAHASPLRPGRIAT
jgi:hypothetical protein